MNNEKMTGGFGLQIGKSGKVLLEAREDPAKFRLERVMKKDVISLDKSKTVLEAAALMLEKGVGCVVVTDGGKPVGIVTERDIICEMVGFGGHVGSLRIECVASKPLVCIDTEKTILDAADAMVKNGIRRLLVIGPEGMSGIVTSKDLVLFISQRRKGSTRRILETATQSRGANK